MNWDTIQQLIRIIMYAGGSFFLGDAIANGELYTAMVSGVVSVGAFLWWFLWERNRVET